MTRQEAEGESALKLSFYSLFYSLYELRKMEKISCEADKKIQKMKVNLDDYIPIRFVHCDYKACTIPRKYYIYIHSFKLQFMSVLTGMNV